jgi:hypothetical protein
MGSSALAKQATEAFIALKVTGYTFCEWSPANGISQQAPITRPMTGGCGRRLPVGDTVEPRGHQIARRGLSAIVEFHAVL